MVAGVAHKPSDQRRRRRRARITHGVTITQADIAQRLGVSTGALSEYENEKAPLPYEMTPEDYEREFLNAIRDKREGK